MVDDVVCIPLLDRTLEHRTKHKNARILCSKKIELI